jgi:choline dehydrogenase
MHYLEHPGDVAVLAQGVRLIRQIATEPDGPFRLLVAGSTEVVNPSLPGSADPTSAEYLEAYVRSAAISVYHPACTCAIGTRAQPGVVAPDLRVRGVRGLRVADASVMLRITTGNINWPTMMIGEKAAELVQSARAAGDDGEHDIDVRAVHGAPCC